MAIPCFQVDAFSARAFRGNPAAVCLLDRAKAAAWMQNVAVEMNLSETAFVVPLKTGFRLRWFTPACEVELCGHATLAAAHVLFDEGIAPATAELTFRTRSGLLTARPVGRRIELDFPARPALAGEPSATAAQVQQALGAKPRAVVAVEEDLLVELGSARIVERLRPDLGLVAEIPARGVIVTARGGAGSHDFVSRFFGPRVGVPEDPVTGSAHCALAPYWAGKLGRTRLRGYQASARGGDVEVELVDDRVRLRGAAVTTLRGQLVC